MSFLNDNFISHFFVLVITFFAGVTGNFLVAVIVFTLLMKLLLLPLDIQQRRSMKKISSLQDKVNAIRQRYKNDPQLQSVKVRELYKKENVKTSAGCLPLLLSLPILFAMFGAIRIMSNSQMIYLVSDLAAGKNVMPESALWVHNIWMPDSGTEDVMPTISEYATMLEQAKGKVSEELLQEGNTLIQNSQINGLATVSAKMKDTSFVGTLLKDATSTFSSEQIANASEFNYERAIKPVTDQFEGYANGYWLFPILAGVTMLISTKIASKRNAAVQNNPNSKMMEWMMPIMIVWFATTAGVCFAIYYIGQNLFAIGQNLILNYLDKKNAEAAPAK